jgi:glycosyltransferase involved in cell wall biosynthesis
VKILLLAHRLPWPLYDGYKLHNHHYVAQLGDRHQFHLVAVDEGELPAEQAARYGSVTVVPPRTPPDRGLATRLAQVASPDQVFDFDPAVMAAIEGVIAEHGPFDVVWTSGAKMLVYSHRLSGVPALGDIADEAAGEAWLDVKGARGPLTFARALRTFLKTWRFQKRYLAHTPICTVVSEADRATLGRNFPDLDVRVVPNGVDSDTFCKQGEPEQHPSLVFEGAMGFRPNAEGIVAFCDDTLPLIRERVPDVHLIAVGKEPTPEVEALAGPGVTVTGFVDDVRPWVDKASVFVCPLRRGAGIKNKILQAWSMEKAVVATPVSCGGLHIEPGENILVAESPQAFADATVELLADPERRAALGAAGRATVLEHYSWASRATAMEGILQELVGGAR